MKDFSGSFKNPFLKEEEISTQSQNLKIEMINEFGTDNNIEENEINTSNNQNQINNNIFEKNEDNEEIEYVMNSMEKLRINHPESFELVIDTTKEVMDLVNKKELKGRDLIKKLDELYKEIEKMDIDYLFWCSHKCLKIAILEQHNIDLVHFFIIKKGFNLSNRAIHKNLINEYLKSFQGVDFINGSQEEITKYVYLLQMLINQGNCDVNDNFDDQVRNSPLHYCIVFNQLQFFIILLKFKYTNINKINLNGDTPLDFACENVIYNHEYYLNKEFAKLLIQHGGKTNNMTHKYKELMQILIEDGEDIEQDKDLNINKKSEKESNKNKNEKISCCTISTEPMDLKNKQKEEYNFENKTIIIGKTKEIKDKNNNEIENKIEEQKNVTKPKLCTKTISI
jgi:ankyrin repeat protein